MKSISAIPVILFWHRAWSCLLIISADEKLAFLKAWDKYLFHVISLTYNGLFIRRNISQSLTWWTCYISFDTFILFLFWWYCHSRLHSRLYFTISSIKERAQRRTPYVNKVFTCVACLCLSKKHHYRKYVSWCIKVTQIWSYVKTGIG